MKEIWKSVKASFTAVVTQPEASAVRTNRELLYGSAACIAIGLVIGMLISPRRSTSIGSNNGGNIANMLPPEETPQGEE